MSEVCDVSWMIYTLLCSIQGVQKDQWNILNKVLGKKTKILAFLKAFKMLHQFSVQTWKISSKLFSKQNWGANCTCSLYCIAVQKDDSSLDVVMFPRLYEMALMGINAMVCGGDSSHS